LRQSEGQEIKLTLHDYAQPYQEEVAKNKELTERVEALEAQIAAMQGKERPRPPRPLN
jgi:cell division protein FtsB